MQDPTPSALRIATTQWTAEEIDRRFQSVLARPITEKMMGASLQFASAELEPSYNTIPSFNFRWFPAHDQKVASV